MRGAMKQAGQRPPSRAVANAPVQRQKSDAEDYATENMLGIQVSRQTVLDYVENQANPLRHRRGLLDAWNENQQDRWILRTDLEEEEDEGVQEPEQRRYGIGTYNINHLSKTTDRDKRQAKIGAIDDLLGLNDWLELLSLQEVNDPSILGDLGEDVEVLSQGPLLRSKSVRGSEATREVYPLLGRKGSGWVVDKVETFIPGDEEPTEWTGEDDESLIWRDRTEQGKVERKILAKLGGKVSGNRDKWFNGQEAKVRKGKRKDRAAVLKLFRQRKELAKVEDQRTRPVILYRLANEDGRRLNVGVVHTTPSGAEFGRQDVYGQLSDFLGYADQQAESGEPGTSDWVILGDYYLADEADVNVQSSRKFRDREDTFGQLFHQPDREPFSFDEEPRFDNLVLATSVSATNWPVSHQPPTKKKKTRKKPEGRLDKVQIADFLITSKNLQQRSVGLFDPWITGIWPFDPDHRVLREWMKISDHVPVGGLLSTSEERDEEVRDLFRSSERVAFPEAMRELDDLLSLSELQDEQQTKKRQKKSNLKKRRRPSSFDEDDAFFWLSQDEVPEGTFSYYTHDLGALENELKEDEDLDLSKEQADKLSTDLWFGDGTIDGVVERAKAYLGRDATRRLRQLLVNRLDDHKREGT